MHYLSCLRHQVPAIPDAVEKSSARCAIDGPPWCSVQYEEAKYILRLDSLMDSLMKNLENKGESSSPLLQYELSYQILYY